MSTSAASREDGSKTLRDENGKLIARCERAVTEALHRYEKAAKDRVSENQAMRKRLEQEIRETSSRIELTKNTIAHTKSKLKSLDEPMELCSTCASWRKHRSVNEHILDPVSTKLQEHQLTLLRSSEELRAHSQSEKFILQELIEQLSQLKDDHNNKTMALHIDLRCLAPEAVARPPAGEKPRSLSMRPGGFTAR